MATDERDRETEERPPAAGCTDTSTSVSSSESEPSSGEPTETRPGSLEPITSATRFGRVSKCIESGLYDSDITPSKLRGYIESSSVSDVIRAGSGRFYTENNTTRELILFNEKHSPDVLPLNITPHNEVGVTPDPDSYYSFAFRQNITITYSSNRVSYAQYSNAIRNALGPEYVDSYSKVDYPVSKSFVDDLGVTSNPSYVDITSFYNFYQESVEEKYTDKSIIEQQRIPNFYSLFLDEEPETPSELILVAPEPSAPDTPGTSDESPPPAFSGGSTGGSFPGSDAGHTERHGDDPTRGAVDEAVHPPHVLDALERGILSNELAMSRYNNVFLMSYDVGYLTEISKKKVLFPMYVDIEFSMDPTTEFAEYIKATKMTKIIQRDICNGYENNVGFTSPRNISYFESKENIFQRSTGTAPEKRIENSTINKRIMSFEQLMSNINTPKDSPLRLESTYFYSEDENLSLLQPSPIPTFDRGLMTEVLKQKVKILVRQRMRTYRQMTEGVPCYSETFLYRVEKLRADNQLVQNFYFLNSNDINLQKFIDTQVKYEQGYKYNVFGYEMIVGSKYQYSGTVPSRPPSASRQARITLTTTCKPDVSISENLLFSKTVKIVDSPSIAPDVEFVQFKGKNLIRLLLNGNTGSYIKAPVIIEPTEVSEINDIIDAQGLNTPTSQVLYRSDDHPVSFEVYRTTARPTAYKDFAGKILASVSTDIFKDTPQKATSATYDDMLRPNTKYYYMIRSRDIHNKLSYPSHIHQVEIVKNSGIVYMAHEICELDYKKAKNKKKGINKFIKISPATEQSDISSEMLNLTYDEMPRISLGTADETLWNRRFKMRITSKSTGRRAEVDFRFTHKHETDDS